jgi:heptosyltransferase-3
MKILVVKRDKIGDLLLTTPLLSNLRCALPNAQIDVLANDYNAWVVKGNPCVNRLWIYRRARAQGRFRGFAVVQQFHQNFAIRAATYDIAIVANGEYSPRAVSRTLRVGAIETISYSNGSAAMSRRLSVPPPTNEADHEIERLLGLGTSLGVHVRSALARPEFALPKRWSAEAQTWLDANHLTAGRFLVVGIGARYPETQPHAQQVLRWARWAKDVLDLDTVVHFTPGEPADRGYPGSSSLAREIHAAALPYVYLLPPRIDIAIAIVGVAHASVLPDGGLMHFAALSAGGVVGLFASRVTLSSPLRWGPRGEHVVVVDARRAIAEVDDHEVLTPLLRPRHGAGL